ncbi:helix-turn-helix transcriptional regulator [Fictibacillus barbaricus]|uniref:AraC-like DNA-binding protein n=1 Tax=Fictibacillus barbaricus TaxID=182136 RepID=A0ABU1TW73_9BACL|nr:AraC family transcriptional regulator [Fictibacillus barbaricus]MDR7071453.1 AraC-like DNA-binding protein [Fictibacillus barbaricus]
MRSLNLKLQNSKLMITQLPPQSSDPIEHDHGDDYQISIPLSGTPFIDLNQKTNLLSPTLRTITSPGEKHLHFTADTESKILLINLNKHFVDEVVSSKFKNEITDIVFNRVETGSSEKFIKIADELIRKSLLLPEDDITIAELEWQLAETLLTLQTSSYSDKWKKEVVLNHHPVIKNLTAYIYENSALPISLEDLSKETNMSKYYLIRTFKEVMGITPGQFIIQVRLEKAVELLKNTNTDITTAGFQVGFGSLSTFERTFRKRFGMSISDYRKNYLLNTKK